MTARRLAGAAIILALAVPAVAFRSRLHADLWPPDSSRVGPNLVAWPIQAALTGLVLVIIWPPTRRRIHRFVDGRLGRVHDRIARLEIHHATHHEHLEQIVASLAEVHAKLDKPTPVRRARKPPQA